MPVLLQKNKTYLPILSSYYFSSQSFQGVSYFHEARHISRFIFFRWGHPDVQMGLENETTCRWWFKGGCIIHMTTIDCVCYYACRTAHLLFPLFFESAIIIWQDWLFGLSWNNIMERNLFHFTCLLFTSSVIDRIDCSGSVGITFKKNVYYLVNRDMHKLSTGCLERECNLHIKKEI